MRPTSLMVLLLLTAAVAAPAAAAPARVVAEIMIGPERVTAPASFPINFGQNPLGKINDATFTACFGESEGACDLQGTVTLLQGLDTPFFVAGVFREVLATGAVTPASFPVTLQAGQRLKVLFQWVTDRLGPVSDSVSLRATATDGTSEDLEFQFQGTGTSPEVCVPFFGALCLKDGRFKIEGHYLTPAAVADDAHGVRLTTDTGYFWFFNPSNVEVMIKVLDGCSFNNRYWVFAGGLTNVRTLFTVTDNQHDTVKIYINPQNRPFQPLQDTSAFATCP
jgi:hypothetical protein